MSREVHVRFCESPRVRFPRATYPYVRTWSGFLFLAVVLDVYSRHVVGWAMANHMGQEHVLYALETAIYRRKPRGDLHHSDQRSQYTSIAFGKRCKEAGIRLRRGLLEIATTTRCVRASTLRSSASCWSSTDSRSNAKHRRHSALGYISPNNYERRRTAAAWCRIPTVHVTGSRPTNL